MLVQTISSNNIVCCAVNVLLHTFISEPQDPSECKTASWRERKFAPFALRNLLFNELSFYRFVNGIMLITKNWL